MMIRSDFLLRAMLAMLFTYLLAIGATFNGVLAPDFKQPTLILMGIGVALWLLLRWRKGWLWYHTPLDAVIVLWIIAFILSLLTNLDVWRRVVMGLWYVSVYIGIWYILQDVLANRGLRRETFSGALLIAGFIVLLFGYIQLPSWLNTRLPLMTAGVIPIDLPRPVSTIGNTNALACFLVVLIPFIMSSIPSGRNRFERIVLILYAVLAIFLLFLTYSRGAWVGFVVATAVWLGLSLAEQDLLSVNRFRIFWNSLSSRNRAIVLGLSTLALVAIVMSVFLIIDSFAQPGRSIERRTILFEPAIKLYAEKPLTGHGLFTFGRGYMRHESLPPNQPHSHAHNVLLLVAAELGLVGIFALLATIGVMFLVFRRNWRAASMRERRMLSGAIAAVVGFGVHHLIDTPAMMPAIALTGLLALALALAPTEPIPVSAKWRLSSQSIGIVALWLVLLGTGFWSSTIYSHYMAILSQAVTTEDYRAAADSLQSVIETDPSMALYIQQQAFLYGMAASEGDNEAASKGVETYRQFLALEPYHAPSWANLASLHWQLGQQQEATSAMEKAVEFAPEAWQLSFNLATYYEETGRVDEAREIYERIWSPCNQYPEWQATELRREVLEGRAGNCLQTRMGIATYVVAGYAALENGDPDEAVRLFALPLNYSAATPEDRTWLQLSKAELAWLKGNSGEAENEIRLAYSRFQTGLNEVDFGLGINIAHFQFMRQAIPRQFLPQIYYPTIDPLLLNYISELSARFSPSG
jgi:putative inorganic carbon (HCO3(-)) transporter